jgi:hypothetical protein
MDMAGREGEPEPFTTGPATNGLTGDGELIEQAPRLGQQHRAAGITPFGDARYVSWDEGSACLLDALGATSPTTGPTPGRHSRGGRLLPPTRRRRGQRYRARPMTQPQASAEAPWAS